MNQVFLKSSIQELKKYPGPLRTFGLALETTRFQLYQVTGFFSDPSPDEKKAGFHRGNRSIYMDFERIPPNEWLMIFTHEMAHVLDENLKAASEIYADDKTVKVLADWAHKVTSSQDLPPEVREKLTRWIKAGLDRGLVAEYRAWHLTFVIYREGLNVQAWRPIAWLDEILAQQRDGESHEQFVYRYLHERFEDPTHEDPLFQLPLIKSELFETRSAYLKRPPEVQP